MARGRRARSTGTLERPGSAESAASAPLAGCSAPSSTSSACGSSSAELAAVSAELEVLVGIVEGLLTGASNERVLSTAAPIAAAASPGWIAASVPVSSPDDGDSSLHSPPPTDEGALDGGLSPGGGEGEHDAEEPDDDEAELQLQEEERQLEEEDLSQELLAREMQELWPGGPRWLWQPHDFDSGIADGVLPEEDERPRPARCYVAGCCSSASTGSGAA